MRPLALALVAIGSACGPAASPAGDSSTVRVAGPSGKPAGRMPGMRALLERYSPSGHYLVTTYEALPTRFSFGDTTIDLTHSGGFADYFTDETPASVVDDMGTAVHEVYHGYSSLMAYQMLADQRGELGAGARAVYLGDRPMLVTYSRTFPSRAIVSTFPADARIHRYKTYISESSDIQSTQVHGVFGLLDELAAYYHSGRTVVDFWPWIRDEAPADRELFVTYLSRFHQLRVPYAEFRLYILHYLVHGRDHDRAVYDGLLANASFRAAFIATIDAYAALLAEAEAIAPKLQALAARRGLGDIRFLEDPGYQATLRHLASPTYRDMLAALR